jgi:hypothetical protein
MDGSGSIAGRSRSTPAKFEETDVALMVLFVSAVLVLYVAIGIALYALFLRMF